MVVRTISFLHVRFVNLGCIVNFIRIRLTAEEIKKMNAVGIILSGGPLSVDDADAYSIDPEIFSAGIPILGICYGTQLIVKHFGGKTEKVI